MPRLPKKATVEQWAWAAIAGGESMSEIKRRFKLTDHQFLFVKLLIDAARAANVRAGGAEERLKHFMTRADEST